MSEPRGEPEAVVELERELDAPDGGRLGAYTRRAAMAVVGLAIVVGATGLVGLGLGLAAVDSNTGRLVVVVACLPAILAPAYVALRTRALAESAANPKELAHQAKDLLGRVKDSPDLRELADRILHGRVGQQGRFGRARGAFGVARLAGKVVQEAEPDPKRHRLLVPLQPDRLRNTWLGVVVSMWAWLVAAAVCVGALIALAVDRLA